MKVFEIGKSHLVAWGGESTVHEDFCPGKVCSLSVNITRVVNLIAATCPSYMMRILFSLSVGGDDVKVGDLASFGNLLLMVLVPLMLELMLPRPWARQTNFERISISS